MGSDDDKFVYCGTDTGDLMMISLDTGKFKGMAKNKQNYPQGITATMILGNGDLICGTKESNIYWVKTDGLIAELRSTCHFGRINAIAFPRDYSKVFVTSSCSDLRLWDAEKKQELLRIRVPNMECNALCFFPDGKLILTGWSDG